MQYWELLQGQMDWRDNSSETLRNLEFTRLKFSEIGLSKDEINDYIDSGYVVFPNEVVVDRYYGGELLSFDNCTRIPIDSFLRVRAEAKCSVSVYQAKSIKDVLSRVSSLQNTIRSDLVYRGQTISYKTQRVRPNPFFEVPGYGEISLVPSLWRTMLKKNQRSFRHFLPPPLGAWSKIISSTFDLVEIESRQKELLEKGHWIHSAQDMADSDDPLLCEFGNIQLDLTMEGPFGLASLLATLLQHYGIDSPVLDLTSDIEVAIFFATHKLEKINNRHQYNFIGSNNRKSVIFLFNYDEDEMREYTRHRVVDRLKPLRPERQFCKICTSGPYAINLAGLYLVEVIHLDFDLDHPGRYSTCDIFPSHHEDRFLAALLDGWPFALGQVTTF
jgi:hypothetical protein